MVGVLAAMAAFGCGKTSDAASVTCEQSLADYCATSPCPTDFGSFCTEQSAFDQFGTASCADGGGSQILVDWNTNTETIFQYDTTGKLEAVLRVAPGSFSCVAGPSTFELPSKCMSGLVAYGCVRDAGLE